MNILNKLRLFGNKISGAVIDGWPSEANQPDGNPPYGSIRYFGDYGGVLQFWDGKGWVDCGSSGSGTGGGMEQGQFGIKRGSGVTGSDFVVPVVDSTENQYNKIQFSYTSSDTTIKLTKILGDGSTSSSISIPLNIKSLINNAISNISYVDIRSIDASSTVHREEVKHGLSTEYVDVSVYRWTNDEIRANDGWYQVSCDVEIFDENYIYLGFTSSNRNNISGKYKIVVIGAYPPAGAISHEGTALISGTSSSRDLASEDPGAKYTDNGQ